MNVSSDAEVKVLLSMRDDVLPRVLELRRLVMETLPDAEERAHAGWGIFNYYLSGELGYVGAQRETVVLGLTRGVELPDPDGLLTSTKTARYMRQIRLPAGSNLPEGSIRALLLEAAGLNRENGATRAGVACPWPGKVTSDALRIELQPATVETLRAYAEISIEFRIESVLRVELIDGGISGMRLIEEPVEHPYTTAWDTDPPSWATRWDTSEWAVLVAYLGDQYVGGAVIATHTGDMWFLRRRADTVALWDIRVDAAHRSRGVGHALFGRVLEWARERGFRRLMIESQNTNVVGCRFYARQGCYLGAFEMHAYVDVPDDVELTWYYDL